MQQAESAAHKSSTKTLQGHVLAYSILKQSLKKKKTVPTQQGGIKVLKGYSTQNRRCICKLKSHSYISFFFFLQPQLMNERLLKKNDKCARKTNILKNFIIINLKPEFLAKYHMCIHNVV